ncbi:class I SAM-dependent methyltransferase [Alkalicoccobacillus murimartini]|uniref:2-polyprenyl-3-methyl-5-hydroxy-6-metoxy-1, 4-benzoquinol methylase n=1 Tax=Alkalicoccobacillus murimartini TaxID=171685 RepID=A0ABT9YGF0_9BACI|nr:class I SAM-dependent methyltransferase [Alkalicoccobacillus murimartini]MDQ0206935.1 2-polyprenyl-3-methyl-5-hydroxy-6-metoxy-1,4-benzoquinol methylase [Alkalicoccobacillus murimartini]
MSKLNVETWNNVYSEGRSLLQYPDEIIISSLNKNKGKFTNGLDIACGAGRHTFLMNDFGIEAKGIDSSVAAIAYANKKAEELGLLSTTFENKLVQDLTETSEFYDVIIVWGLIHYLEEQEQTDLINKVYSMLKPGGVLLSTLRSKQDSRMDKGLHVEGDKFLVDYFDRKSDSPKQTIMYFWDEAGVRDKLDMFKDVSLGHRSVDPIGDLGHTMAHWLIEARK